MLAMQYQLEVSQWWSADVLLQRQLEQLSRLFYHAHRTIPFYKARLELAGYISGKDVTMDMLQRIPLLKRSEIQEQGDSLMSKSPPKDHGRIFSTTTSGSTGRPIRTYGTEMNQFFWHAMTLRDHLWHRHDFSNKLAVIRAFVDNGAHAGWGPSTDSAFKTGKSVSLNVKSDLNTQLSWLINQEPEYLLTYPSNLMGLAKLSIKNECKLPSLQSVRTFGEILPSEARDICREAWGVEITDSYSCMEAGYLALQCPEHEHYHVPSEVVLIEILNEDGAPCELGTIGRVVLTTLHNFAMPLIRYEISDYAEAGQLCSCGRGLPVINRILGRKRNLVTLPDGSQHWPVFPSKVWMNIGTIRQMQLIQKSREKITIKLVSDSHLSSSEELNLKEYLQENLRYSFEFQIDYVNNIERGDNLKYEDFKSELSQ